MRRLLAPADDGSGIDGMTWMAVRGKLLPSRYAISRHPGDALVPCLE